MARQNRSDTLETQITQLETLSSHKPADLAIRSLLADLYLKKGLVEKSATAYKETLELSIGKKDFKLAFEILGKVLFSNAFDIIAVKDILSVLKSPETRDSVHTLYQLIAQYRLTINKTLAYTAIKRMHQLDPSDAKLLQLFREMETPDEAEEAALSSFRPLPDAPVPEPKPQAKEDAGATARSPESDKDLFLKNKFVALAKEKAELEATILQQHDTIKDLEQDKQKLSNSLKKLIDEQRKMKEKLLDYDILRNMEISDLKKKVDTLIADNKRILTEREAILKTLDRDRSNLSAVEHQKTDALNEEKKRLEELLALAHEDLKNKEAIISVLREQIAEYSAADPQALHDPTSAASGFQSTLSAAEQEIAAAQAEIRQLSQSLEKVTREKELSEEALKQKTSAYHQEVGLLKIDLEELTLAIEEKIRQIDDLTNKVTDLNEQLSRRDSDLSERIPGLLAKINQLSLAIDRKMEENSLFAKELSDLNMKIADLHRELIQKDELLIGLSRDYREEAEQQMSRERDLEDANKVLTEETRRLKEEIASLHVEMNDLRHAAASPAEDQEERERALSAAREEAALLGARVAELEAASAGAREETARLRDALDAQAETLRTLTADLARRQEEMDALRHAHDEERTTLEQQIASFMQDMPEKDAALARTSEELSRHHALCADLQQQVSRLQLQLESQEAEHRATLAESRQPLEAEILALQDEVARLRHAAEEQAALRAQDAENLTLQVQRTTELEARLLQEKERCASLASTHEAEEASLQARIAELTGLADRAGAEADSIRMQHESLKQTFADHEARTTRLVSRTEELEQTISALHETLREKEQELLSLQESVAADRTARSLHDAAEEARPESPDQNVQQLARALQEKESWINDLRAELEEAEARHAILTREHADAVERMDAERAEFHAALAELQDRLAGFEDQSRADRSMIAEMKTQLAESVKDLLMLNDEKRDLLASAAEKDQAIEEARSLSRQRQETTERLRGELSLFRAESEKQTRLLETLRAEKASLTARLEEISGLHERALQDKEVELRRLKKELEAVRATIAAAEPSYAPGEVRGEGSAVAAAPEAAVEEKAVEVPQPGIGPIESRTPPKRRRKEPPSQLSPRTALLLIILLCLAGYYAYRELLPETVAPATVAAPAALGYDELFTRDTRSADTGRVKLQATFISPELMNAGQETADRKDYDFEKFAYFRITVSSLKNGLDKTLAKDPSALLRLRTERGDLRPSPDAAKKPAKTFYRRDIPVSTSFLAAFPKAAPDALIPSFSLVLKLPEAEVVLPWSSAASGGGSTK
ncbi:MAG: hypothetical protein OHK006_07340 [Thermodesulfovibrionales bacterium]